MEKQNACSSAASASHCSRREWLAQAMALAALGAAGGAQAAAEQNEKTGDADMSFRYWMHGFGGEPKETAAALKEMGFNVVVAGGEDVIAAVTGAGMESWLMGAGIPLGEYDADKYKARDIQGNPQTWFGSGCPNDPVLREQSRKHYAEMAATEGISGILVDGCRFASPASGFYPWLTCFCSTCEAKAQDLGFNFAHIRKDVQALHDMLKALPEQSPQDLAWLETPSGMLAWLIEHPGVLDWLRFRRVCTTEHFKALEQIIHGAGHRMGVYIFTPSVAPLVGQSYEDLAEFVDVFAPMIYRNYPDSPGPACLNWELTAIPAELGLAGTEQEAPVMGAILNACGLERIVPDRNIESVRQALPPAAVGQQTKLARARLPRDKELAPIIYIDDPLMKESADQVRAHGADGLNFFVFGENWRDLVAPAFKD